jgi:hypothetical protein
MKVACSCAGGAACDGGEQGVTLRVRRIGRTVRQGAGTKGSCEASESSGLIGGEGELFEGGTALHDVPIILEEVKKAVAREDFLGGDVVGRGKFDVANLLIDRVARVGIFNTCYLLSGSLGLI